MHSYSVVVAIALLVGPAAQSKPARTSDGFDKFLGQLATKLRKKGAPKSVDAFDAQVTINDRSEDADVDFDARIIYQGNDGQKKLRVEITEGKTRTLRVKNELKYWMQQGEKPFALSGKDYQKDRSNVRRDFALAKLTARFLFPDRELRKLSDVEGPVAVELFLSRKTTVKALRVVGYARNSEDFPLALSPEHRGRVRVTAWFRKENLEVLRLELVPMLEKAGKPEAALSKAEVLRFSKHGWSNGLLLPHQISVFHYNEQMRLIKRTGIMIDSFKANPKIEASIFRMK